MQPEDKNDNKPGSSDSSRSALTDATVTSSAEVTSGRLSGVKAAEPGSPEMDGAVAGLVQGKTVIKERFVLEELLGSGGMGTVYKAIDLRKVEAHDRDPWLAIKLLNDNFKRHSAALISLQREARKSQALTHPNIIKVFDFDRDADVVYMTMEMLQGCSLKQHIQDDPQGLEWEQALGVCRQMGNALQHAHENGIIHADFSPKNVFLTRQGEAKVLDFGIAQAIAVADANIAASESTVFDPATLGGLTPGYASFEQLTGKKPVPADDVFALGCVIYQLLSGEHPHNEKTALDALSAKIRPRKLPRLSGRQWRALQKAMALLREERYPTVADFLHDFMPSKNPALRAVGFAAGIVFLVVVAGAYQAYSTYSDKQAHAAELLEQRQALAASRAKMEQEQVLESQRSSRELERISSEYLALAEGLIADNRYDEAQQYLDKVRGSTPGYAGLGEIQTRLTSSREAYRQHMVSREKSRMEIEQLVDKVELDIAAGKLVRPPGDSAYSAYQQIIVLEPENVSARAILQRLVQLHLDGLNRALQLGELQEASRWLDDLVMIAPDNRNLSRFRAELKQALALEQQRQARINALLSKASKLKEGNAAQRRDMYLQILEIEPLNPTATRGLASAREEIRRRELEQQQQVQQDAQARLQLAEQLLEKKPPDPASYRQAREYLLEAQRIHPGTSRLADMIKEMPQRYIRAIEERISAREYDQASAFVQAATTLYPQDPTLLRLADELTKLVREQEQLVLPSSF